MKCYFRHTFIVGSICLLVLWTTFAQLQEEIVPIQTTASITTDTSSLSNNETPTKINNNIYIYYYGQTCGYCKKVEEYLKESWVDQRITIIPKEITLQINAANREECLTTAEELWIPLSQVGTPFVVVNEPNGNRYGLIGADEVLNHFKELEQQIKQLQQETQQGFQHWPQQGIVVSWTETILPWTETEITSWTPTEQPETSLSKRLSFFAIMAPAALADSINPCAFAVMLLLLTTILSKSQDKKKALKAWLLFSLAVFLTYFLLWMGVLQLLGNFESLFRLKRIVGILGLFVAFANLKDYFRYGKGFVMEIPLSWRPTMQKIIKKVVSPFGAFVIGVIVSLFLLPCSSGPYLTILGYLSAESQTLNLRGYTYLTVYNLIFVLPMIAIALLIGLGYSTAERIGKFKNKNTKLIHLIVGLLMLGLSIYVIGTLYRRN